MKKCFYFPTWEEQKDVMISFDEKEIFTNCKSVYNDELVLQQQVESNNFEINFNLYKQSTPSDPILAKLCELTGAKMYGDYVVLEVYNYNDYESIAICTKEFWTNHYDCSLEQYKQQECGGSPFYSIKKIIGGPLNLERILVALNKQNQDYAYSNGKIMLLDVRDEENDYHNEIICEWQPNKTLESQSEETIKAIYDILCV